MHEEISTLPPQTPRFALLWAGREETLYKRKPGPGAAATEIAGDQNQSLRSP
jgi:hypothetical protein